MNWGTFRENFAPAPMSGKAGRIPLPAAHNFTCDKLVCLMYTASSLLAELLGNCELRHHARICIPARTYATMGSGAV